MTKALPIGVLGAVALGVCVPAFAQTPPGTATSAPEGAGGAAPQPPAPAEQPPPPPAPAGLSPAEHGSEKPADARTAQNALYVELAGAAFVYSINYDRRFEDMSLRVGFMYFQLRSSSPSSDVASSETTSWVAIPLSLTYVGIGSSEHSLEVGGGITVHNFGSSHAPFGSSRSDAAVLPHAILGYRYQPLRAGFFFRAGLSQLFAPDIFLPWPHVGLGATF